MSKLEQLLVGVVALAGGEIVGRIRLQKVVYLLDQIGMNSGASFEYRHYGPYSEAVSDAVTDAKFWGHISEAVSFRVADGAPYSSFKIKSPEPEQQSPEPEQLGNLSANAAKQHLKMLASHTSTVLELAATVHWLAVKEKNTDWRSEIEIRKVGKTSNGRLETALRLLKEMELAPIKA